MTLGGTADDDRMGLAAARAGDYDLFSLNSVHRRRRITCFK